MASTTETEAKVAELWKNEIAAALAQEGCPLCRVLRVEAARFVESFWREGRRAPDARRRFVEAGGFCSAHAWLLHDQAVAADGSVAVADLYGTVARSQLELIESALTPRRRALRARSPRTGLAPVETCPACSWLEEAETRKAVFLAESLAEPAIRRFFAASDGLCARHFHRAADTALEVEEDTARFLLADQARRLRTLVAGLDELDRKRDHRYAREARGEEDESWVEAIRRYAGDRLTV